jgi:D-alanine-D-alanine ligase
MSSGTMIAAALRSRGHRVVPVDMYIGLEDYGAPLSGIFDNPPPLDMAKISEREPDLDELKRSRRFRSDSLFGQGVLEVCSMSDVVFIAMHGICGEDGRVQAALELMGVPFTGSGYLPSAVAMDKNLTKRLLAQEGILTPDWFKLDAGNMDAGAAADRTALPCVVKPLDSGSSIGVDITYDREGLIRALNAAASMSKKIIVEQYIRGRELQVGVLDGSALPSIEIIVRDGFYDYKNKYQPGAAIEVCPADIPAETEKKLGEDALFIHNFLNLSAYSRSDFILGENGGSYFLEVNTLPGMTPTSLIPQEAAAAGISYAELCEKIVELAVSERGRGREGD